MREVIHDVREPGPPDTTAPLVFAGSIPLLIGVDGFLAVAIGRASGEPLPGPG
jgi:hypothetical protein